MKVRLKVPTSLKDVKLSQFQKYVKATLEHEDNEILNRKLVSILCNVPEDFVLKIERKYFLDLVNDLAKVLDEKPEVQPIIFHNGREYGLIPNMEQMTVGEQADLDSLWNDYDKRAKVMSILYRPIKAKRKGQYLIEDYTSKEEPLDLTMDIVRGAEVFFYNIVKDLMNITQSYISQEAVQTEISKTLDKNGVGIKTFMRLQEEIFLNLKEQLN